MPRYNVIRQHFGDRAYWPGDDREAAAADVTHLVAAGVLEEVKVEAPVQTKGRAKK